MPFKFLPQPLSLALYCLRRRRGLYIRDLAELLKVPVSLIERYEGEDEPPFEVLLDWGLRMGYSADRIEWLAFGLTVALGEDPVLDSLVGLSSLALQKIRESAGRYCRALFTLTVGALTQITRSFNIDRAREEAAARWQELQNNPREHRKTLVEYHPRFQTWAVSERLADESEKAASDRADRALELAQLALRAAELAPGDEATRAGSLGYARALLANARRVGNRLDLAESDFALALAHWEKASPEIKKILADWRMKDLEGSLRRDQRRFPESLERLKEARAMAPAEEVPRILVKRAVTLEQMWQPEEAVKVLREAEALCGSKQDAELRLKIYFNLAANLGHIEDFAEMTRYVPIVLELAIAG
ncbi:MAG TPA: hypothetical protein DD490_18095, partial [Acidobacteria bacterium]|nr:hypothetical protein [Acidobacteriota bacterium]